MRLPALALLLLLCGCSGSSGTAAVSPPSPTPVATTHAPDPTPTGLPRTTLTLDADQCGVTRPELSPAPPGLVWRVKDESGHQVLRRNAMDETSFRYGVPGTFTIDLEAFNGSAYVPISPALRITCI